MTDPFMDHLPSHEREKIRKRMRSPEAYEKLRERVKGPEDLEREMERNIDTAELKFALESDPQVHEALKAHIEQDVRKQGLEQVLEKAPSPEARKAIEQGKFRLAVSTHPTTQQDQLMVLPEGNVQEKLPVKASLTQQYATALRSQE